MRSVFAAVWISIVGASLAVASEAAQENFLVLRERAQKIADISEALEPYLQTCKYEEEYLRRQCEALKERLMFLGAGRLLRYTVASRDGKGPTAIEGKEIVLRACLTCNQPAEVSEGLTGGGFVLGKLPKNMRSKNGTAEFEGIELAELPIGSAEPAKVAPALVTEFLIRPRNEPTSAVGKPAQPVVVVDIVGYRVYDRCAGKVYGVSPGKGPEAGGSIKAMEKTDPTCPGYVKPVVKVVENLPPTLGDDAIKKVLEGAREDVLVCYDKHGVGGYAPAKITVTGSDGRIHGLVISGKFEGTPTAECIEKVMRAVRFPRFQEKELHIDWQFFLAD